MMDLERFEQLVDSELDGDLSPEGRAELERACALNPDLRRLRHKDLLLSDMLGTIGPKAAPAQLSADVMRRLLLEKAVVSEERRTTAPAPPAPITHLEPPPRQSLWNMLFGGHGMRWAAGLATSGIILVLGYLALSVNDFNRSRVRRNQEARQIAKADEETEAEQPSASGAARVRPLENAAIASVNAVPAQPAPPIAAPPQPTQTAAPQPAGEAAPAEAQVEAPAAAIAAAPAPAAPTITKSSEPEPPAAPAAPAPVEIAKAEEPPAVTPSPAPETPGAAPADATIQVAALDANEVGPLKKSGGFKQMVRKGAQIIEGKSAPAAESAIASAAAPAPSAAGEAVPSAQEAAPAADPDPAHAIAIEIQLAAAPPEPASPAGAAAGEGVKDARAFNGAAAQRSAAGKRERDLEILFVEMGGQILDRDRDAADARVTHVRGLIRPSRLLEFLKEIEARGIAPRAAGQASVLPDPGARGAAPGESFYTFRAGERPGDVEPPSDEAAVEVRFAIREER